MMLSWLLVVLGSSAGAHQAVGAELELARADREALVGRPQLIVEPCRTDQKCVEIWRWER